ncbi:fatty acid CoA ligase family protein [Prolixibacteraceae bacterium Z1-6]|uniref:Fatty acid CoA ligase family protein n=1 Tax=Draconibacterium aestuarii TaxID=2998507 RepID=A0A9X3J4V0_9BACT|nr:fatty acid CoA ligase family protein [Prolixibacteraceae bacterium Z1-6]
MKSNGVQNISDHLYQSALKFPDKPMLLHPGKVSYKVFCKLVDAYATGFINSGIVKGTKTIVLLKPGVDFFATTFALLRIGAIPVMIDPGMGRKAMIQALANANAGAFIGIAKSMLLKYISPKNFKSVCIWISGGCCWDMQVKHLSTFRKKGGKNYEVAKTKPNDETAIFFTSGSTGPAKGVVYTKQMMEAQIAGLKNHFNYNPKEIDLCTFPLIGLFSMCLGLSVVLADMDMVHPARLQPEKLVLNIYWYGCTYLFCSPVVLQKLAEFCVQENLKLNSLKRIMTAGAPVTPELLSNVARVISDEAQIHTPYGATEALPVTDINHKELLHLYENSPNYLNGICVGYPLEDIKLKVVPISDEAIKKIEDVEECDKSEVGEIVIQGENVSQGYLNDQLADKLSKIAAESGNLLWHRTGDLGRIDDKGRVWYYGRKSQRVQTETKVLFTIPVEAVFNRHPQVERSALVGVVANGKTEPVICIQAKKGTHKSEKLVDELKELALQQELTHNISEFIFVKKFPVDARHNAKIHREKLAEWAQKMRK